MDLSVVVFEVNLVRSNPKKWWIDIGVTYHVRLDKSLFISFEPIKNRERLFMGNSVTPKIQGRGKVILRMIFGKNLTLNNMLYVLEICKNLVSRYL